jgi:hypothetical protein
MGVVVGLLVGGYFNVFNVPVMEWAISLEGAAAAEAAASGSANAEEAGGSDISLGEQRIGFAVGLAVFGVLFGAIFTGMYHLVRRATPGWNIWAWAVIAGLLCFWAVTLFTQMRYPPNPPGIGEEESLLMRQLFQLVFILVSLASAAGVCLAAKFINESGASGIGRFIRYGGVAVAYAVVAIVLAYATPANPDTTPDWLPNSLVILFRTFTITGFFLLWMGIALGVAGYIRYRERGISAYSDSSGAAEEPTSSGASIG